MTRENWIRILIKIIRARPLSFGNRAKSGPLDGLRFFPDETPYVPVLCWFGHEKYIKRKLTFSNIKRNTRARAATCRLWSYAVPMYTCMYQLYACTPHGFDDSYIEARIAIQGKTTEFIGSEWVGIR